MSKKRLFLIDGSGLIFRAFFAIQHLNNKEGRPTNATFGFTMMLRKIIYDYQPTHVVVALDTKEKTFRHEMFAQYKANRPAPPPELIPQFDDIRDIIDAYSIAKLTAPGFEADDIIGTLAHRAIEEGFDEVVVVTSDKDFYQIVNDRVTLLDTKKNEITDIAKVKERFGTEPKGVIDALGLAGDSSDNIPGIPGVGEKTAKKLLEEYGSFEGIYDNINKIKGKLKEKLADNRESAELSRKLVTIKEDVSLDVSLDDFAFKEPDSNALEALFTHLDFRNLLSELTTPKVKIDRSLYRLVDTEKKLSDLITQLETSSIFAFDTETTSTSPVLARLVGMSFCCDDLVGWYVPLAHSGLDSTRQLPILEVLEKLRPVLENKSIAKIAHNAKYDYMVMKNAGIEVAGIEFDTMLASYVLDPGRASHSLDSVAMDLIGHKCISYKEVTGKGKDQKTFDQVPIDMAREYAGEDAHVTWLIHQRQQEPLKEQNLTKLFKEIEMPLLFVLAEMETSGVKIDSDFFAKLSGEYSNQLNKIEEKIHNLAGHPFNLNSPKQVGKVLFEEIGLKPVKKTKSGPSTDVTVLEALSTKHEIPATLLGYRQLHKLVSTYIDALPKLVNPKTGRIHGSFNQTVAATGRLSSSDPNLQNIPVRTEEGRRIREGFVPEKGKVLLSADYSQIELRIMAHLSGDKAMVEHFKSGEDIHRRTASEVFQIMPALVSKEQRFSAKAINFGILYGISAFRLGKDLNIGTKKATEYINMYFARYPDVKTFLEKTIEFALEKGYVETMLGRKRLVPQLKAKDHQTRAFGERIAYNTPIQGTAADLIKVAMIRLSDRIKNEKLPLSMIIQVHDELLFEVPKEKAEQMMAIVIKEMEGVANLKVPLIVDACFGKNWAEIH